MNNKIQLFKRNVADMTPVLKKSVVGIAGCGGLGSNAAIALVRAGIGKLILVDFDVVEYSNLNRQYYFQSDVGQHKTTVLAKHCKNINPHVHLDIHLSKLLPKDIAILFHDADILIEAFDLAESKQWLIETWCSNFPKKPIVCASGISGYGKTNDLTVRKAGNIYVCGDEKTDMKVGLCASRVAIAANMQANIAIEILVKGKKDDNC